MKASDFDLDFSNGGFNCCQDHIYSCDDDVEIGSVIECEECGIRMILTELSSGAIRWFALDKD
jgi:hypothetical protein